jgi:hypothetical protein
MVLWWDLHRSSDPEDISEWSLVIEDATLEDLLKIPMQSSLVDPFRYALAADYIEENWDRLLSLCETAAGVDPEPLLRRLLERLRTEWADCLNGVGK